MIGFQIFTYRFHCAGIQISSHHAPCSEHQRKNPQDSAAGAHIQKHGFRRHKLFQLPDAKLCCLMHPRPEGRTRINMKDHLVLIRFLHLFPGRDNKEIINIKLVKILLPVIDPVDILRLVHGNASFSDVAEYPQLLQLPAHIFHDGLLVRLFAVYQKMPVLCFLHEKAEPRNPVILRPIGQDVHEHLLLFRGCQRHLILDLRPFQANIIKGADNYVLRIRYCFYPEFFPFHIICSLQVFFIHNFSQPGNQPYSFIRNDNSRLLNDRNCL